MHFSSLLNTGSAAGLTRMASPNKRFHFRGNYLCCIMALALLLILSSTEKSIAENEYFFSLYGGQASDTEFLAIIRGVVDFKDYYLVAGALGKKLTDINDKVEVEVEGQIVKHIKGQYHWEFNPVLTLRWHPFPWDHKVDTSFAWGNGLSFATEDPKFEVEESIDDNRTSQVLYYFMVELEFAHPDVHNWSVFSRIHHRSGVFGLIDDIVGGSNYVTFGLRYQFN